MHFKDTDDCRRNNLQKLNFQSLKTELVSTNCLQNQSNGLKCEDFLSSFQGYKYIRPESQNRVRATSGVGEAARRLRALLLSQRAGVGVPALTCQLTTISNSTSKGPNTEHVWCMHWTHVHMHICRPNNQTHKFKIDYFQLFDPNEDT